MSSSLPPWQQAMYTHVGYAANPDISSSSSTHPQPVPDSGPPTTSTLTAPKTPKQRRAITDAERKALRTYYFDPFNGKPRHKSLGDWFESQYNHRLSQSTISECLGPKYKYLDADTVERPKKKKNRAPQWPELELALFHWEQGMMHMETKVTGEMLKKMAARFWESMDQYAGQEPPKFSDGWVDGYRTRHPIKKRVEHSDALQALKTLQHHARQQEYAGQQKNDVDVLLRNLSHYEGMVKTLIMAPQVQQPPSENFLL